MPARLPVELEDEIMKVRENIHKAQGRLTTADILSAAPPVYPKRDAIDPTKLPGVSRWDYNRWEKKAASSLINQAGVRLR